MTKETRRVLNVGDIIEYKSGRLKKVVRDNGFIGEVNLIRAQEHLENYRIVAIYPAKSRIYRVWND